MWRVTLRGLFAHKVRYALTTLAVLLGVAFMAGTFVFTDTIRSTFDGLFGDIYRSTSAVVRGSEAYEPGNANFALTRPPIPESLVERVRAVPGVAEVRVGIGGYAQLVGSDGDPIGTPGNGAPTLGQVWNDIAAMNPYRIVDGGRPPRAADEVAIDKHAADVGHLHVGDRVTVLTKLEPEQFTITGLVRWGTADSPLGATITLFTLPTAQRVIGTPGMVDEIAVAAQDGITQQQMMQRLREALPGTSLDIVTGVQITRENQNGIKDALAFFDTFLLVFALIALFVGSFLIFNTFSIVVAQRLRELALLRAVGASRSQVAASVLGEAVAVGLLASVGGIGAGIGVAYGLHALLNAIGMVIPSSGLVVSPRTLLVCLLAGTGITLLAALPPARRAARIPPVAALQATSGADEYRLRTRGIGGAVVLAAGVGLLLGGLYAHRGNEVLLVGLGAAGIFVALSLLGPFIVRPFVRLAGTPLRWRGVPGVLAVGNAIRNPKRTATTAAALVVGVAVVTLMSVVAASIKSSVRDAVETQMRADLVISSGGVPGTGSGFSPQLQQRIEALPQVASAAGLRVGLARIAGSSGMVLGTETAVAGDMMDLKVTAGELAAMTPDGLAVSSKAAADKGMALGQQVQVTFPSTGTKTFTVQVIYGAREIVGDYLLPIAAATANFPLQLDFQVYVHLAPGVGVADGRHAIEQVTEAYPTAKVQDREQYVDAQLAQIDQLLNLVYGLLMLALLIALLGIANTLTLAVHERTRELGLLRAVGMTRGQLRAMIRYEAVVVAVMGTLEGLAVGVLLGWAFVRALGDEGISSLAVPGRTLAGLAVIAVLAGVVAAVRPSWRASRLDILRAIGTQT